MRWWSLGFHLFCRVLRIFLIAATTLHLLLFLQLWLPEAAGEKHDFSPTWFFSVQMSQVTLFYHPFGSFWSPWDEGISPLPPLTSMASGTASTSTFPPNSSSTSFSFLLSVAGPLHYCLSATQLPPAASSTNESARKATLQWEPPTPLPCILLAHLHQDTSACRRQRGCNGTCDWWYAQNIFCLANQP